MVSLCTLKVGHLVCVERSTRIDCQMLFRSTMASQRTTVTDQVFGATTRPSTRDVPVDALAKSTRARPRAQTLRPVSIGAPAFEAKTLGPMATSSVVPCPLLDPARAADAAPSSPGERLKLLQLCSAPITARSSIQRSSLPMNFVGVIPKMSQSTPRDRAPGREIAGVPRTIATRRADQLAAVRTVLAATGNCAKPIPADAAWSSLVPLALLLPAPRVQQLPVACDRLCGRGRRRCVVEG
mmetsp:Transcript_139558/g.446575  ORF Transcript_139558/g.446575 Transcript_139558/m.446575 type:complete len:240 (-) Transcript_139558:565-1284(-)